MSPGHSSFLYIYPSDIFELKALSTCPCAFSDAGAHVTYARE